MNRVYISSWAHGKEPGGLWEYSMDPETGELSYIETHMPDTSFNVSMVDREKNIIYALSEVADWSGMRVGGGGSIHAWHINPETGKMSWIGSTPTYSPNPAFLCFDKTRRYMLVANHGSRAYVTKIEKLEDGSFAPRVEFDDSCVELFSMNEDGTVGKILDVSVHEGSGPYDRQTHPHPHSVNMSPSGDLFAVCDKGNDRIYMYGIDYENEKLVLKSEPFKANPGDMPRYNAFHPAKSFLFANNEGADEIYTFGYTEDGKLTKLSSCKCVPEDDLAPVPEQQGFCISSDGKFIYEANNGRQSVSVFEVNEETGELKLIQSVDTGYAWTRGANLSPDGKFLIVCCFKGGKAVVYSIKDDGTIEPTDYEADQVNAAYTSFWSN